MGEEGPTEHDELEDDVGERFQPIASELRLLSEHHRLGLGGPGAESVDTAAIGALALTGDPVAEAERVTALVLSAKAE